MAEVFTLDVFIICFRESLEAAVIIAVLLAFCKQTFGDLEGSRAAYKRMLRQIWIGAAIGIFICLCIGGGFIGAYHALGEDIWGQSEDLWEGVFSTIACVMITAMGIPMLRINKMRAKWRVKIAKAVLEGQEGESEKLPWYKRINPVTFRFATLGKWSRKYAMLLLPLVTTLREGVEAIVFVGGVGVNKPAKAFPLSVILGLLCGFGVGVALYFFNERLPIKYFLIFSTCLLYLIAAGLFSRAVWYFEMNEFNKKTGGDVAESGNGPGSYNIKNTVWHVNCCSPETNDNGWGIANAILGWQNTATYGSVISYNCYWIFIMVLVGCLLIQERTGSFPIIGRFFGKKQRMTAAEEDSLVERAKLRMRNMQNEGAVKDVESLESSGVEKTGVATTTAAATK